MLGYFPAPLPDEMLYSVFARYADRMPSLSREGIVRDLFGEDLQQATLNLDFPSRLDALYARLPPALRAVITVEDLINRHTLVGLVSPFKEREEIEALKQAMRGGRMSNAYASRLFGASAVPEALRYCPECVREDARRQVEPYWRRMHQIGCVRVCPEHGALLVDSDVRRSLMHSVKFIPLRQVVQEGGSSVLVDPVDPIGGTLLWLAREVRWLLDHPTVMPEGRYVQEYVFHLTFNDLATYKGVLRLGELNDRLAQAYPPELLATLGLKFDVNTKLTWVRRTVKGEAAAPVAHLLMWHFLGLTASEFLTTVGRTSFFERGPWPCLNPACGYYGKDIISSFESRVDERGQLFALFACTCGFEYSRQGPDLRGERRWTYHKMVRTGAVWDDALRRLWFDRSLPVGEICARLDTYEYQVHQAAQRLGLPRERPGQLPLTEPVLVHKDVHTQRKKEQVEQDRRRLLEFLDNHPHVTRTALQRDLLPGECRRLMKFDREWFEAHAPRARYKSRPRDLVIDRGALDADLAFRIPGAREALLAVPGRPQRITRTALLAQLGFAQGRFSYGRTLTKTEVALEGASESLLDVAIRRIKWLVTQAERGDRTLSSSRLIMDARVRPEWLNEPGVARALAAAEARLTDLSPQNGE